MISLTIRDSKDTRVEESQLNDDISCISEGFSISDGSSKPSSPIKLKQYFGADARNEFGRRIRWLSNQRKVLYRRKEDMLDRTRFEYNYDSEGVRDQECLSDDDCASVDSFDVQTVQTDVQTGSLASPRTKFISSCLKRGLNPRMSLIVRRRVSPELNLQHQGMGDELGILFAESLRDLPCVNSINLADNNLSDISVGPLLNAIIALPHVTHLNLSNNRLDRKSTAALARYLKTPSCPLRRLVLQKSDIDDDECHMFVDALTGNMVLEELDLGSNKIGQVEMLNVLQPDIITGGEAIASLLAANTCGLQTLHLGWNMIRLDGGIALADCLSTNDRILHLDLSYNTLGQDGGEHLGNALLSNDTIKTLLLANNGINFTACFAICVAIEENLSLRQVQMDGNPIGEGGGRILMQVPFSVGCRVKVSASRCNLMIKDSGSKFDPSSSPVGFYELALNRPYERAVCIKLLRLIADSSCYMVGACAYDPRPADTSGRPKATPARGIATDSSASVDPAVAIPSTAHRMRLVRVMSKEKESRLDEYERITLHRLHDVLNAATDVKLAQEMFRTYDVDGSGCLDRIEVRDLLSKVGLRLEEDAFLQAMDLCDVDSSGELDEDEFLDFLRMQKEEASYRIKSLTEFPVMALAENTSHKYIPPETGMIYIQVCEDYSSQNNARTVTAIEHSNIMELVRKGVESVSTVLEFCIQNSFLRQQEARHIFNAMYSETRDPATIMMKLLPRMSDPNEARAFMMHTINFDKASLRQLVKLMGNALRPILGRYDGYYDLDLSMEMDRICLGKLLKQNEQHRRTCMSKCVFEQGRTGDLSQYGDWSAFRNAVIDGESVHISTELFNPIPKRGHVCFDFSGTEKAPRNAIVVKDSRCVNVLLNLSLVLPQHRSRMFEELETMEDIAKCDFKFDGTFVPINDTIRAEQIQLCMCKFYDRLPLRSKENAIARALEEYKYGVDGVDIRKQEDDDSDNDSTDSLSHLLFEEDEKCHLRRQRSIDEDALELGTVDLSKRPRYEEIKRKQRTKYRRYATIGRNIAREELPSDVENESAVSPTDTTLTIQSDAAEINISGCEVESPGSISSPNSSDLRPKEGSSRGNRRAKDVNIRETYLTMTKSNPFLTGTTEATTENVPDEADDVECSVKANRIVEAIVDIFSRVYLRSRHLALILRWFFIGRHHRTRHFGSYRVELAVQLFCRVVDTHNFDLVLRVLQPYECAHFICRMGILNVFNPLKPEGAHCLCLARRDERVAAKILTALSVTEPGENLVDGSFRWEYDASKIPGWELTESWLRDEDMLDRGFLSVTYSNGTGCAVNLRKSLLYLVRISEADILSDENNVFDDGSRTHIKLVGKAYIQSHQDIWDSLLAPVTSSTAQLGAGLDFFEVFPRALRKLSSHKSADQEDVMQTKPTSSKGKVVR